MAGMQAEMVRMANAMEEVARLLWEKWPGGSVKKLEGQEGER